MNYFVSVTKRNKAKVSINIRNIEEMRMNETETKLSIDFNSGKCITYTSEEFDIKEFWEMMNGKIMFAKNIKFVRPGAALQGSAIEE